MDHPPGSVPAPRRTTLVAFLVLLMAVIAINILTVLPYVLTVIMGSILAVLSLSRSFSGSRAITSPREWPPPWSCSGWSW
jgi:hypothetical protein